MNQEDRQRQQACSIIEAIGGRIGLYVVSIKCLWFDIHMSGSPRKTIASAQNLYHRFHLYFPRKDFSYYVGPVHLNPGAVRLPATQDATLAALYVSNKMHDTLKKPQDILMVSLRSPLP